LRNISPAARVEAAKPNKPAMVAAVPTANFLIVKITILRGHYFLILRPFTTKLVVKLRLSGHKKTAYYNKLFF